MWRRNLIALGLIFALTVSIAALGARRVPLNGVFAAPHAPKAEPDPNADLRPVRTSHKISIE
jgi:hypothetical protein